MDDLTSIHHRLHLILKYEGFGNYTKLMDAFNRSGLSSLSSDKFFYHNVFQSLWMSGILNVSWESSSIRWSYNPGPILVNTQKNKRKVLSEDELLKGSSQGTIYDQSDLPLIFTQQVKKEDDANISWDLNVLDKFSSFSQVVDLSVERVLSGKLGELSGSYYDFKAKKWKEAEHIDFSKSGFIKILEDRNGYSFFIFESSSNVLFKVVHVEWMYLIACYLLNKNFKDLFEYQNNVVTVSSSIRLPTLIARYLFSNSRKVKVSFNIIFEDIDEDCYRHLLNYLNCGDMNE